MRVGVSAKVFLAYAVLLVAFGTNAVFLVASLHSARQQVIGHNLLLDLAAKVETAHRRVLEFDQDGRSKPELAATYFAYAAANLEDARRAVERFLADEPGPPAPPGVRGATPGGWRELERETRADPAGADPLLRGSRPKELDERFPAAAQRAWTSSRTSCSASCAAWPATCASSGRTPCRWRSSWAWPACWGPSGRRCRCGAPCGRCRSCGCGPGSIAGGDYGRRIGLRTRATRSATWRASSTAWPRRCEEREQRLIRSERLATVGRMAAQITHEIRNPLASIGLNAELLADELGTDPAGGPAPAGRHQRRGRPAERDHRVVPALRAAAPAQAGARGPGGAGDRGHGVRPGRAGAGRDRRWSWTRRPACPRSPPTRTSCARRCSTWCATPRRRCPAAGGCRWRSAAATAERVQPAGERHRRRASPPEHVARIFEPFFSTKDKGTGLGLALVQQIVTEHGGRIEVHSDRPAGDHLPAELPRAAAADAPPRPTPAPTPRKPAPAARPAARALAVPQPLA